MGSVNVLTMSVHDIRDRDDVFNLSRVKIYMKRDFMNRCASLPLELKFEILYRCPIGTVKFLRKNTYFWRKKREYDEQQYGKRAKMYWKPGPKRILWDPTETPFNLHSCKRPKGEDMPIEFEISQFWTDLQLCHATHQGGIVRPYRSGRWFELIGEIERLTYGQYLLDIDDEVLLMGELPSMMSSPESSDDEQEELAVV